MATSLRRLAVVFVLLSFAAGSAFSQSTEPSQGFGFELNLGIGVQSFNEGATDEAGKPIATTYQSIGLTPDISYGNFGVGIALVINYRFTGDDSSFEIRRADWVPDPVTFQSVASLYLPKIMYVRWGQKGDPLFLKFGSFNDATLGDGFIMGEYANTLFLPDERHFGLQAGLDGNLFQFPYLGLQTVIGNVAAFDVLGARLYVRPLAGTEIPILKDLEIGGLIAADRNPDLGTVQEGAETTNPVTAFGGDVRLPLVFVQNVVSLLAYADVASLQGTSWGGLLGVGGKLINVFTYGLQLRFLGENFIADYFGPTYDLIRDQQYDIINSGTVFAPGMVGWLASIGTSFLDDKIIFKFSVDGPFKEAPVDPTPEQKLLVYPHLRGIVSLAEGVVPGITFDFSYDKKAIDGFGALIDPTNAAIQAQFNFKTGPAVISFVYKIVYDRSVLLVDPEADPWTVTSGLQSSISLF